LIQSYIIIQQVKFVNRYFITLFVLRNYSNPRDRETMGRGYCLVLFQQCLYLYEFFLIFVIFKNILMVNSSYYYVIYSTFALFSRCSWHFLHLNNKNITLIFWCQYPRPLVPFRTFLKSLDTCEKATLRF